MICKTDFSVTTNPIPWHAISTAPRTGDKFWGMDSDETIYKVRWFEEDGVFIDQFSDDVVGLRWWCLLENIVVPDC